MNQLEKLFSDEKWSELNEEVRLYRTIEILQFLTTIRDDAEDYAISDSDSVF
jgi:excinuclease UvrABC nuclease subunit